MAPTTSGRAIAPRTTPHPTAAAPAHTVNPLLHRTSRGSRAPKTTRGPPRDHTPRSGGPGQRPTPTRTTGLSPNSTTPERSRAQPSSTQGNRPQFQARNTTAEHTAPTEHPGRPAAWPTAATRPTQGLTAPETLAKPRPSRPKPAAAATSVTPHGGIDTVTSTTGHARPATVGSGASQGATSGGP